MLSDGLQALLALAETGSVTAAAQRRNLTQPALTRQLQRLAAEVGCALVERRGRGVALTAAGEAVAGAARRQRSDWEATLALARGGGGPAPLHLACGATIALTVLPAALARLRQAFAGLPLRITACDSATAAGRLLAGDSDAALVTTAPSDRRLATRGLVRDPLVVVGMAHPTAPRRLSLREIAEGPLCLYPRGTGFRAFVDGLFAGAGLFPEPVAELDSLEALRELVVAGIGRSLLPRSVIAPAVALGRLVPLDVPDLPRAERTITLVWRADRPAHPALAKLEEALRASATGDGPPG